ncbi:Crp/Fnr family transcriptional regulator [Lachnospiraceae bacterium MD1]|uniref:Crp/Fnr family transcriptional regulator n=1 Tax=Variimorphobacter saccharofermentans TaxID=2755051 RepID=A0A839K132_9FIRM|nr:Crp/Fnr family transcriptional regulator [Variimorphobacter saccharofermentans]MBB2183444.1 Crp/Fnr family transcriptional regulator [Variimorphobacter saccharofermentans]
MKEKLSLYDYLHKEGIDYNLIQILKPLFTHREYRKGEMILHMGENTKVVCLILQGIARGVYIDTEGKEITKCFSKEGDWCCVYNMLTNRPSEFWIEALEDCQVEEIAVEQLRGLLNMSQQLRMLYEKLYNNAFVQIDEKGALFQKMQGRERYLYFINKYPDIAKRVKQEYIASYIGITPSSLSRIKREL